MSTLRAYHWTLITQHTIIVIAVILGCIGAFFVGKQTIHTLQGIDVVTTDIHSTFEVINRPRTGTLAGLNEDIFETKGLLDHSNEILNHEQRQLTTLDSQEAELFTDLHSFMNTSTDAVGNINTAANQLNTDLQTTNTTIQTANTAVGKLSDLSDQLKTTIVSLNGKINDPDIKKATVALAETSVQIQGTATDLRKVSDHFEKIIDSPKKKSTWQKIQAGWGVAWQILMLVK